MKLFLFESRIIVLITALKVRRTCFSIQHPGQRPNNKQQVAHTYQTVVQAVPAIVDTAWRFETHCHLTVSIPHTTRHTHAHQLLPFVLASHVCLTHTRAHHMYRCLCVSRTRAHTICTAACVSHAHVPTPHMYTHIYRCLLSGTSCRIFSR